MGDVVRTTDIPGGPSPTQTPPSEAQYPGRTSFHHADDVTEAPKACSCDVSVSLANVTVTTCGDTRSSPPAYASCGSSVWSASWDDPHAERQAAKAAASKNSRRKVISRLPIRAGKYARIAPGELAPGFRGALASWPAPGGESAIRPAACYSHRASC